MSEFVYIGTHPRKAWDRFQWSTIASSRLQVSELLSELDGRRRAFLVVSEKVGWRWLLQTLASQRSQRRWRSRVLGLADLEHTWAAESLLDTRFEACVRRPPVMLPVHELAEVLEQSNREDFCIGGSVERQHRMVVLVRGNLDVLPVPMASFEATADGVAPDFDDFEVIDYGQTLRFGDYEASFDAVLYEMDQVYRRRLNRKRRKDDRSFGASLRRLRLQRGLGRDDFPGVSAKSIARIERDEVERSHPRTLEKIAHRLGVDIREIETF